MEGEHENDQVEGVNNNLQSQQAKNDCEEQKKDTDKSKKVPNKEGLPSKGSLNHNQICTNNSELLANETQRSPSSI